MDERGAAIEAFRAALYRYKVEAFFHHKAGFPCPRLDTIENAVTMATAVAFEAGVTRAELMPFARAIEDEIYAVVEACPRKLKRVYKQLCAPFADQLTYETLSRDYWRLISRGSGELQANQWWREAQEKSVAIRDRMPLERETGT